MMIAKAAALFEVPASAPTSLTASITDTLGEPGVLAVVVFVAALPLVFWLVKELLALTRTVERIERRKDLTREQKKWIING
jgi:hypothetical protein